MIPFGLSSLMTVSMPVARRTTKCLVPGASAVYLCNQGTGTTLTDFSGNGLDGTFGATTKAPTWATEGVLFDGGDYVTLPNLPTIQSIAVVFYAPADIGPATAATALFGCTSGGVSYPGLKLGASASDLTNEIIAAVPDAAGRAGWCDAAGSIAAGWHLLSVNFTGTAWTITLDGAAKTVTPAGTQAPFVTPTAPFVGAGSAASGFLVNGSKVAALLLYPSSLTATQEAQNATALEAMLAPRGVTLP